MVETMFALSTLSGLLAQFFSERRHTKESAKVATITGFIEWLRRHHHAQALAILEQNADLSRSIASLLASGQAEIMARFDRLDQALATVLQHVAGWEDIARAAAPITPLSEQALLILTELERTGSSFVVELPITQGDVKVLAMDRGNFQPPEPRFLQDDLQTLVGLGLLHAKATFSGSIRHLPTRLGSQIAREHIKKQTKPHADPTDSTDL